MAWKVGASRSLRIVELGRPWDGDEAKRRMLDRGVRTIRRGCLVYDDEADPETLAAYKLPFAWVMDGGDLVAAAEGLRAAASRLPQTDIPDSVKEDARRVLDAYFERMSDEKAMEVDQAATIAARMAGNGSVVVYRA